MISAYELTPSISLSSKKKKKVMKNVKGTVIRETFDNIKRLVKEEIQTEFVTK